MMKSFCLEYKEFHQGQQETAQEQLWPGVNQQDSDSTGSSVGTHGLFLSTANTVRKELSRTGTGSSRPAHQDGEGGAEHSKPF